MKTVRNIMLCILLFSAVPARLLFSSGTFRLPPVLPPEEYGDVLMDKSSPAKGITPVVFSHWTHRSKYTCRVCHVELEFALKANMTGVICNSIYVKGKYCGACHNGKITFGPHDASGKNCARCHNANARPQRERFLAFQSSLPRSSFGNEIDWGKALNERLIRPKTSLTGNAPTSSNGKEIILTPEAADASPVVFPHRAHEQWLDCTTCHPDIFPAARKTTLHYPKSRLLSGEFCGVCHLRVAFPMDDCMRCHRN